MAQSRTRTGRKALHQLGLVAGPPLESDEQARVFEYLKTLKHGTSTVWDYAFAIPNGSVLAGDAGQRARQMASMKRQGLKPSVSDIFVAIPVGGEHGLFIEMKRVKGSRVDPEQLKWAERVSAEGYRAVIAKGFDEARLAIDDYFGVALF